MVRVETEAVVTRQSPRRRCGGDWLGRRQQAVGRERIINESLHILYTEFLFIDFDKGEYFRQNVCRKMLETREVTCRPYTVRLIKHDLGSK